MKTASMGRRYLALVIDYFLIACYGVALFLLSKVDKSLFNTLFTANSLKAELTGFLLITFPVLLYFSLMESSAGRGTLGKWKAGIIVTDLKGRRLGVLQSFIRSIVKFLPWELAHFSIWHLYFPGGLSEAVIQGLLISINGIAILYFLFPFSNSQRKALHDWIAKTRVCENTGGKWS